MAVRTGRFLDDLAYGAVSVASIDLSWSGRYYLPRTDITEPMPTWDKKLEFWQPPRDASQLVINPMQIVLLTSRESVHIPKDHGAFLVSKSTPGRRGLLHAHTGWFDPDFGGVAAWEVFSAMPFDVVIQAGQYMVQLVVVELDDETEGYKGQYHGTKVT